MVLPSSRFLSCLIALVVRFRRTTAGLKGENPLPCFLCFPLRIRRQGGVVLHSSFGRGGAGGALGDLRGSCLRNEGVFGTVARHAALVLLRMMLSDDVQGSARPLLSSLRRAVETLRLVRKITHWPMMAEHQGGHAKGGCETAGFSADFFAG